MQNRPWNEALTQVEMAINNAPVMGTEFSPYYLNFGFHPAIIADLPRQLKDPADEDIDEFANRMTLMYEHFARILQAEQKRVANRENSGREPTNYQVGDLVMVNYDKRSRRAGHSSKLDPRFVGPYRVLRQVSPDTYELALPPTSRAYPIFHAEFLRPYYGSLENDREIDPDEEDGQEPSLDDSFENSNVTATTTTNCSANPNETNDQNSRNSHFNREIARELRRRM